MRALASTCARHRKANSETWNSNLDSLKAKPAPTVKLLVCLQQQKTWRIYHLVYWTIIFIAYIAASHRKDRSAEAKAQSAERASDKYKQNTGQELDINEEGEAVKPDYQQRSA